MSALTTAVTVGATLGIANAAHCIGMCGPIALHVARPGSGGRALRTLGFLAGKATTYAFLGAIAGRIGHAVGGASSTAATGLSVAAAIFVMLSGLAWITGGVRAVGASWTAAISRFVSRLLAAPIMSSGFALGVATGFIPCGAVWVACSQAATTGRAELGVCLMVAFGLATGPAIAGVTFLGGGVLSRIGGRWLRVAGGLMIIATGAAALARTLTATVEGPVSCCH